VAIKQTLGRFLREELKLELSEDKTLLTHARTGRARFLGYDIVTQHADHKITQGARAINGRVGLRIPQEAIARRCALYMRRGKPLEFRGSLKVAGTGSAGGEGRGHV
jgi:hypothetical protein